MKSLLAAIFILAATSLAAARDCIEAGSDREVTVAGVLAHEIFPGPPNYTDVAAGDDPEPTWLLVLDQPVCLSGDDSIEETRRVSDIHLLVDVGDSDLKQALRVLNGQPVIANLSDAFGAHTRHHHAPIVALLTRISAPQNDDEEEVEESGTPATTVRGFYLALEIGDGDTASSFIVPEKRQGGPFDPDRMTAFYGSLKEPLSLLGVRKLGKERYEARYTFETHDDKVCDGLSIVTTTVRDGRNLIAKIKAPNGC